MEQILQGLDNVKVYLDDIYIFLKTWEDHLLLLEKVLSCIEANGFIVYLLNVNGVYRKLICLASV